MLSRWGQQNYGRITPTATFGSIFKPATLPMFALQHCREVCENLFTVLPLLCYTLMEPHSHMIRWAYSLPLALSLYFALPLVGLSGAYQLILFPLCSEVQGTGAGSWWLHAYGMKLCTSDYMTQSIVCQPRVGRPGIKPAAGTSVAPTWDQEDIFHEDFWKTGWKNPETRRRRSLEDIMNTYL